MDTILAFDQGTTGTTALVVDTNLKVVAKAYREFPQHYPKPGWVEHDLNDIWNTVLETVKELSGKVDIKKIAAIGITNQRETLCFWDRKTGKPLTHAIVWQDRRTAEICKSLKEKGAEEKVRTSTGLLIDPYFSGTKATWAFKNWGEVSKAHKEGRLAAGTIDSYLLARLTGGEAHLTEPTNASRTLAFHLEKHIWDEELCSLLEIPKDIWPQVRPSVGEFARTKGVAGLPDGIPITGILGDQQSALMGQACVREGTAKCTYGTGTFMLVNTGKKPSYSKHRLVSTVAWALSETDYTYALEGSAFIAGAAVQWLRDGLKLIKTSPESETVAAQVKDSDGVTFVPALTGLGAPHWDPHATGMFTGITRGTTQAHMVRAVLEGIAFQNAEILFAMKNDFGKPIEFMNVDGGAAANNLLMQFQSDILGIPLKRPEFIETTSMGAVFAAGLGAGVWKTLSEVEKTWKMEREFKPQMEDQSRKEALKRWDNAVARVKLHD